MNILFAGLITLVVGFFAFILIVLNENKEEIWEEIYKKMRCKDE